MSRQRLACLFALAMACAGDTLDDVAGSVGGVADVPSTAPNAGTPPVANAPTITAPAVDPPQRAVPIDGTSPGGASVAGCSIFPPDNPWNADVSAAPLDARSGAWVAALGTSASLFAGFGPGYGIPYATADRSTPRVDFRFEWASDPGPYPVPPDAPIEPGDDRHVIVVELSECKLYELFAAYPGTPAWSAGAGAIFDLSSNALRPAGWTSADAAGLPIFPGLARYDEASSGGVRHALRFTGTTQRGYVFPARHFSSTITDSGVPPMGARARLKASVDVSGFPPQARALARALQHYGMFLADNGPSWLLTGAPDPRWSEADLDALKRLRGADFEFVAAGPVTTD